MFIVAATVISVIVVIALYVVIDEIVKHGRQRRIERNRAKVEAMHEQLEREAIARRDAEGRLAIEQKIERWRRGEVNEAPAPAFAADYDNAVEFHRSVA